MKVLQIIETAYRATQEEQDDTIVWITAAMKGAGGDLDVLFRGNAVNYAVQGQDASGLSFGEWKQTEPPRLAADVARLIGKGINVYYVEEDAADRGLNDGMVDGVKSVSQAGIATLVSSYDQVWHW